MENTGTSGGIISEYARSGSYVCKTCGQIIAKNILRIGYIVNLPNRKVSDQKWYHLICLRAPPVQLKHVHYTEIMGIKELTKVDRLRVKEAIKTCRSLEHDIVHEKPKDPKRRNLLSPTDYSKDQLLEKSKVLYQMEMDLAQKEKDKQEKEEKPVKLEGWAGKFEKMEKDEFKFKDFNDIFENFISKVNYMKVEVEPKSEKKEKISNKTEKQDKQENQDKIIKDDNNSQQNMKEATKLNMSIQRSQTTSTDKQKFQNIEIINLD